MHELSLTRNLLEIVLKHAGARRILHVNLLIGEFSHEREEAIRFYWDHLAKGTPAEHAALNFRRVEAEMKCLDCETVFHPEGEAVFCPRCQSQRLKWMRGDAVRLESIDVE
ncbi:MAG TPA: hydrogenase maturation nickel metallochaperone HypA [Anaerolineales bacterium]|nr:hydrogenase maturation nickel metallochaperone HypA [Anaerolineales bacterium]